MPRFNKFALGFAAVVLASSSTHAQTLTKSGPCPGLMNFQVTGAQPNARLAFIHAANTGSWMILPGLVCGGTITGLAAPVVLGGWATADGFGFASVNSNIPAIYCNNRYLQVVDTSICSTSNVILIN